MKNLRQFVFAVFVALFAASFTAALFAEADPPSRVARLKYISGQVSMQPGGVNDWAEATVNRPMTTSDRLWTDKDSRAELRLGNAAMRMNSETSLTLTNLSDNAVQLELDQGTLNLDVARLYSGEIYEVDTPNMAFTLTKPGAYRFDVDSQSDITLVTVWKGKGIATGNGEAVKIDSHKQVRFTDGMSLMHSMYGAPRQDGFDQWCQVRTDREANIASVRYVSPDVVGYEDLDGYGTWREVPSYGRVWVPVVEAGWAPYSVGHWVWIAPWGWTWVDDAPWGFAPFHYGRWVHFAGVWAWAPGPAYVRPVYAPALVAWVGSSGAGIGWFPLGYGEPYIPSYHVSRGYFETVNVSNTRITNITYVTNTYYNVNVNTVHITNIHYVNQSVPGGMTVVNNEVIVNSRPVNHNVYIGHDDDWRDHDRWVAAAPSCAPSHDSVLGVHAGERARIPERVNQRPVAVKMTPPPARAPFEPRRGDNDRPWNNDDHRADGHMPNPQHGNDEASNRGYGQGNDGDHDRNGNHDGRRDPVADGGRDFPHPGRGHDDDRGQQNANKGHDQNAQDQNAHNGDNDDRGRRGRPDWAGVPHEGSSDSPRYPRPPRSWDGDHSQPSSAGNNQPGNSGQQNGNGDQNQNAHNGNGNSNDNGNNGRRGRPDWAGVPHEGASGSHGPNSSNNDGSQPSSAGNNQPGNSGQQNGNSAQNQNAQIGNGNGNDNGNNGRRGRPDWAGVPHEGASGLPNHPRPSSPSSPAGPSDNDNSQPSSASNNQPNQGQGSQARDDRDNHGRGNGNGPNWNNGQNANNSNANGGNANNGGQQPQNPAWSRPNRDGNWGNRQVPRPPAQPANNGQGNGVSSGMERSSQPVYQAPAASQQAERDVPRPREGVTNRPQPVMQQPQTDNQQRDYPMPQRQMRQPSYSAPSAPAQQAERPVQADRGNSRPAQVVERAAQPQSPPTPSRDSGANGNSHGTSSFQARDHGKLQDK